MRNRKREFAEILLLTLGVFVIVIFLEQKVFQHFLTSFQSFVHIYNISETQLEETSSCLNTKTRPSFITCIYDTGQDIFISKSLQSSGLWEPKMTKLFQQALIPPGSVTVIDVGANIGYFSLYAAALGHHAVAIEPVNRNVQKLAQAIHINKFQRNIIILRNALSNERRRVHLSLPTATNQGSSKVLTDEELQYNTNTVTASSIVLDDLIPFIHTNDVIIKLDIEGHECRSMEKSEMLFKTFRVLYVMTEWSKMTSVKHRYGVACSPERIRQMALTLYRRGFEPYDISSNNRLDPENSHRWRNDDVYWKNIR